jgi:hypothetical protein
MQVWEYKNIVLTLTGSKTTCYEDGRERAAASPDMFPKAKELGEQGWELVSVASWAGAPHLMTQASALTIQWIYWFKRPK